MDMKLYAKVMIESSKQVDVDAIIRGHKLERLGELKAQRNLIESELDKESLSSQEWVRLTGEWEGLTAQILSIYKER